ncbi:MAG: MarR family transcriptional regulator [bacterium]
MAKHSLTLFSSKMSRLLPHVIRGMLKKQSDALGRGKITVPQYLLLDLLNTHELLKMKDIARELNISLPAATGLVSRLHLIKMIKRIYDKNDRRVIHIGLTARGEKTIKQVSSQQQKATQEVFVNLTESERNSYLSILKKLKGILNHEK